MYYNVNYIKYIWDFYNNWPPTSALSFFFFLQMNYFYFLNFIYSAANSVTYLENVEVWLGLSLYPGSAKYYLWDHGCITNLSEFSAIGQH